MDFGVSSLLPLGRGPKSVLLTPALWPLDAPLGPPHLAAVNAAGKIGPGEHAAKLAVAVVRSGTVRLP